MFIPHIQLLRSVINLNLLFKLTLYFHLSMKACHILYHINISINSLPHRYCPEIAYKHLIFSTCETNGMRDSLRNINTLVVIIFELWQVDYFIPVYFYI